MTTARAAAVEALRPFAELADAIDREPRPIARPGVVLLSYGAAAISVDDLRQARKVWRDLTAKQEKPS